MSRILVETERLQLRELRADDLDFLAGVVGDADVMRYWPAPLDRDDAQQWIDKQIGRYCADGCGYWLMIDKISQQPVGQAGVLWCDVEDEWLPCLGYIVHKDHWRRGFAGEAARGCLRFIFDELNCDWAYAQIRPENEPSIGVALKLGMQEQKRVMYMGFEHCVYAMQRSAFAG